MVLVLELHLDTDLLTPCLLKRGLQATGQLSSVWGSITSFEGSATSSLADCARGQRCALTGH